MQLADHIRTLLRDHDCVIIPDFGGLIADYAPARLHPVRHTLAPPTKRVAFNQALTRNDGLLVDALSRALQVPAAQARQLVRGAVAQMQHELETNQRAELTGIGIFRHVAGRGLDFEYIGTDNLLSASYGLPELVSRPVRATDALLSRERQPAAPLLAARRSNRVGRVLLGAVTVALAGLVLSANYMFADQQGYLPEALRWKAPNAPATAVVISRQQAALATSENFGPAQPVVSATAPAPEAASPVPAVAAPTPASAPAVAAAPKEVVKPVAGKTVAAKSTVAPTKLPAAKPAAPVAKPAAAVQTPATKAKAAAKPATKAPGWEKAAATNATTVPEAATIKGRTGRYYVIAGSYTSLANAEKGRQALLRLGHPARVILPPVGSRQFKLSAADFADRTSADRQATILRKRMGNSLWVLNY